MSASYDDEDILSLIDQQDDAPDPEEEDSGAIAEITAPPPVGALSGALKESRARLTDLSSQYKGNEAKSEALYARQQQILDKAMQRLMQTNAGPGKAEMMLALAASLNKPTRTGRFGETMGNVSGTGMELLGKKRAAEEERSQLVEKYGLSGAEMGLKRLDASQRQLAIEAEAERRRGSDLAKAGFQKLPAGFNQDATGNIIETATGRKLSGEELLKLQHPPPGITGVTDVIMPDGSVKRVTNQRAVNEGLTPANAAGVGSTASDESVTRDAQIILAGGTVPAMGRNPFYMQRVRQKSAELAAASGDSATALIQRQAANKAGQSALSEGSKRMTLLGAYEKSAIKTLDLALDKARVLKRENAPLWNKVKNHWASNVTGDPETAEFINTLMAGRTEYMKVLTNATGAAPMTDAAMKEAESLLGPQMNLDTLEKLVDVAKTEMEYRRSSFVDELNAVREGIGQQPGATSAPASSAAPVAPKHRESLPDVKDVVPGSKIRVYENGKVVDEAIEKNGVWVSKKTGKPIT